MAAILIAYATREGQTGKIAEYLAAGMRRAGHEVKLLDADRQSRAPDLGRVDAVVIAAPIHAGGYPRSIVRFARDHVRKLTRVPTAFCSIGLAVASRTTDGRAETLPIVAGFVRKTGWQPDRTELVAGALVYSQYNFVVRFFMRRIARAAGGDVDTSRDYEYTDWKALDRFAAEMSREAARHEAAGAVRLSPAV